MNETNNDQSQKPRTSKLAIASITFLVALFIFILWLLILAILITPWNWLENLNWPHWLWAPVLLVLFGSPLTALILGVAALIKIKLSGGHLAGKKRAAASIIISAVILIALSWVFVVVSKLGSKLVCGSKVKGLGTAIMAYVYDHDQRFPTSNWCDLLIGHADVDPKTFRCTESDAIEGESTYALNKNVIGMKPSEIPGDVVLMFETSLGRTDEGRTGQVKSRGYFQFFAGPEPPEMYSQEQKKEGNRKIYIDRWNQVGGPEDITTEYHKDIGCNVLFADGYARFVIKEGFDTLRWEP